MTEVVLAVVSTAGIGVRVVVIAFSVAVEATIAVGVHLDMIRTLP